jgi:urease accessory protein
VLRATTLVRRSAVPTGAVADTLTLDYDQRHRRRITMTADGGLVFLLDLDRATVLDEGDAVRLEDGRLVQIKAAPQHLVEIRSDDSLQLQKIIWHLGNRHAPAEITRDAVYIVEDHVLVEMVRGLGASVARVKRPFRPEGGAYDHDAVRRHAGHSGHAHDHGHD